MDMVSILQSPWFEQNGILLYVIRSLGWGIIMICKFFADAAETFLDNTYKLLTFWQSDAVNSFIGKFQIVFTAIFAVALVALFLMLMTNSIQEKSKPIKNIMVMVLVLTSLPFLMSQMNEVTLRGIDAVNSATSGMKKSSNEVIKNGLYDLKYLDKNGFDFEKKNGLKEENLDNLKNLNIVETIDPNRDELDNPDVFKNELVTSTEGGVSLQKIDFGGWISFFRPFYYRYSFDFLSISITLLVSCFVFLAVGFKVIRICYDLAFHRFFAMIVAPGDITSGQRIKKILMSIFAMYVTLFFTAVTYRFFLMFQIFLGTLKFGSTTIDALSKALMMIPLAMAVIDGPNIVQQVFGMDVGLNSMFRTFMTLFHGSQAIKAGVAATAHTVENTARATGNAAVGAAGAAAYGMGFFGSGGTAETSTNNNIHDSAENNNNSAINTGLENDSGIHNQDSGDSSGRNNFIPGDNSTNDNTDTGMNDMGMEATGANSGISDMQSSDNPLGSEYDFDNVHSSAADTGYSGNGINNPTENINDFTNSAGDSSVIERNTFDDSGSSFDNSSRSNTGSDEKRPSMRDVDGSLPFYKRVPEQIKTRFEQGQFDRDKINKKFDKSKNDDKKE